MNENISQGISIHTPGMASLCGAETSSPYARLSIYDYMRLENPQWTEEQVAQVSERVLEGWRADSLASGSTPGRTNDILAEDLGFFTLADERYEEQFKELADLVASVYDSMVSDALASFREHSDPEDPFPYIMERALGDEALKLFRARWVVALEDALEDHRREK